MNHFYPVRHPPVPDAAKRGETTSAQNQSHSDEAKRVVDPQMPHEHDESSHSQASATPRHAEIGKPAYRNATDGTQDTDKGPVTDELYNETLAPDRGREPPRQ